MSREELPVFRLVDLRKIYGQGDAAVHALRGVDLTIGEGELLVLLGPSGSGKSTLLNVLGGLDRPSSGSCFSGNRPGERGGCRRHAIPAPARGLRVPVLQPHRQPDAQENVELVTEVAPVPCQRGKRSSS